MFPFTKKLKPSHQPQVPGAKKPKKKWLIITIWIIVVLVVGLIAWLGLTGFSALKKISAAHSGAISNFLKFDGNLTPSEVKTEGDSRINILVAGIGGGDHQGPDLTDTLQIISIDPVNKKIAMLSVPRDLYVKEDLFNSNGQAYVGYGKINEANADGQAYCDLNKCAAGVDPGGAAMEALISQVTGVQINYFARLDFDGLESIVNTLGGIDVNVTTKTDYNGQILNGLYDPLYPCSDSNNNYCVVNIPDGEHHMDGAEALEFARSRETTTDFDRSKRQQQIMEAIITQADSLGFFANPAKVTSVISDIGDNLKTDIPSSEFTQLMSLIEQSNFSNATVATLDTTGPLYQGYITNGTITTGATSNSSEYILYPKAGLNNYTQIHTFVSNVLLDPYVIKEQAKVAVVNATGDPSEDAILKTLLSGLGYNIVSVTDSSAPQSDSTITTSSSKPYTESLLKQRFSANEISPSKNVSGVDITLTVGKNYLSN